jgi:hypothetical protein
MCRRQQAQKNASSTIIPRYCTKRLLSFQHCEATPTNLRGSVIRSVTRECTRDSGLYRAGWLGSDHANLDRAFTESDSRWWRVPMTPKLMKYFPIPWLDRIGVIMETFRTPDKYQSLTFGFIHFLHRLRGDYKYVRDARYWPISCPDNPEWRSVRAMTHCPTQYGMLSPLNSELYISTPIESESYFLRGQKWQN